MIDADLQGKRALVTGAASGIGLAVVECFARLGAAVALNDLAGNARLEAEVARLRDEGHDVIAAPGDVGDPAGARAMVEGAAATLGGLDYLVNNAATPGTTSPIPASDLEAQDEAFWDRLLAVNLRGPFRCTQAAAPFLKAAHGAVVNVASVGAFGGGGSSSVYCVSKAGLVNLTQELARGLGPEVRVNAIAPGLVAGSNWECNWGGDWEAETVPTIPLRRMGTTADYAEVILFLCAGAAYVTGQTITVDGGWRA